jgi:hypothetical protein
VYVKEQMGAKLDSATVDTYGHLIPGANVNWVARLDSEIGPRQSATDPQQSQEELPQDLLQTIEIPGGGGWTRTNDLGIMRPSL